MPVGKTQQGTRPSRQNLSRVWLIRSILIVALLSAALYFRQAGDVDLPWYPLLGTLLGMGVINVLLAFRLKARLPVSENEFFSNLLLDVIFLTIVLYLTGGSANPLVSYYLIPLIISAAVLRAGYTWTIAFLTIGCYTFLFFRHVPFEVFSMGEHRAMMSAHLWGMWINFAFSALLISWFVVRMAGTMREQEHAIAQIREDGLRNEQIISVASIAAGTAHELRTPLSTMTVVVDELRSEQPGLSEELSILQGQLERCDSILRELLSSTAAGSERRSATVKQLFSELLEKWAIARPEITLEISLDPAAGFHRIRYDLSLHHAMLNFLHNAADVSPDHVRLGASAGTGDDTGEVVMTIEDRGPGIPPTVAEALGRQYVSRREGGLGLGVLLSSASIERLGGRITMLNRAGGGTRMEIRWAQQGNSD